MHFAIIMKFVFVTVALFVATAANPTPEWTIPTDTELYIDATKCSMLNSNLPLDQMKMCNVKCVLEKGGFFDETNGFNVEHIVNVEMKSGRSESGARAVAEKCAVKKEAFESSCGWANRGLDCLRVESRELKRKEAKQSNMETDYSRN
ncbi:general odorant-binding protein 99a-like [Bradysia coprophila]|uniref:general odorant-binding protein 99a-like n=1 Tax=Bradysia coprophila TaxID=38358 RepID=UPI00187DB1B6|nr:general odorant-binding protein 99a-like [Bradysia coprophila]